MADTIFDVGIDFATSFFDGYSPKRKLTEQQYRSGVVDFYSSTLEDLQKTTGVGVDEDKDEDEKKEEKRKINVNVVGGIDTSDDDFRFSETPYGDFTAKGNIFKEGSLTAFQKTGGRRADVQNIYSMDTVGTYGNALVKAGFADKTPTNFFGFDLYTASIPKTAAQAKKGIERIFSKEGVTKQLQKLAGRTLFPKVPSGIISEALGFVNGRQVADPLGNQSFRPSGGILGTVFDINMSRHYDNVGRMQSALKSKVRGPVGFASYIDGLLVTRGPGDFSYNGTIPIGATVNDLRRIEALDKGIIPDTFDYRDDSGERGVRTEGGIYDRRGNFHYASGVAPVGTAAASKGVAERYFGDAKYTSKVESILSKVRGDKNADLYYELAQEASQLGRTKGVEGTAYVPRSDLPKDYKGLTFQGVVAQDYEDSGSDEVSFSSQDMGYVTAYGGQIGQGMQAGGPAGFIGGPPENFNKQTTIADDIPLEVPEGAFVINAPAVEYAGSDDISEMLVKAYEKAGQRVDKSGQITKIPSKEQVDIMISRGEVVVPPNIAKIIGYDRLEKINNRGKKEVARRQKQGDQEKPQARQVNQGGFINKAKGDKITVYRGEPPKNKIPLGAKLLQDRYTGSWFAPDKNFTKTYGEVAKSMKVSFDEYKKGAKKAFLKKNIARSKMENEQSGLPRNLTRKQRSQIFQSLKYIDEIADNVKQGKRSTKAFVDFLYEGVFPKEKDRATVMLLETAKRSPKVFGKLVVDSLVKNVVFKGVPVLGAIAGFAPKEMGDATLDTRGFVDYNPNFPQ